MTNEEIQDICDLIQKGQKTNDYFPVNNRMYKGKWYYNVVSIHGVIYSVDSMRQIIFE